MIIIINNIVTLQNTVSSILLTLSFISGGVSSGTNAADVQDHVDRLSCDENVNLQFPALQDEYEEICDNLEIVRDSMIASAVSSHINSSRNFSYICIYSSIVIL